MSAKREAANAALAELARKLAARRLFEMRGKLARDADLDAQRRARFPGWDEAR